MAIERERIPAVVVLMLLLTGSIIIYLLMVPAPVAYKLLGINNTSSIVSTVPKGEYYYNLNTYIGGKQQAVKHFLFIGHIRR